MIRGRARHSSSPFPEHYRSVGSGNGCACWLGVESDADGGDSGPPDPEGTVAVLVVAGASYAWKRCLTLTVGPAIRRAGRSATGPDRPARTRGVCYNPCFRHDLGRDWFAGHSKQSARIVLARERLDIWTTQSGATNPGWELRGSRELCNESVRR